MNKAFTLIELLMTVAIIAIVGTGVAVYYGREVVADARKEMTLHEMGLIRDAFQRFWADNSAQMMDGMTVANSATDLPSGDFVFAASGDGLTYAAPTAANPQRLYGVMEFFERYGLWPLLQKRVYRASDGSEVRFFRSDVRPGSFRDAAPARESGWRGPYATTSERGRHVVDGVEFPAFATKYGGAYRVVFYEHCADDHANAPIFRRLLLVAAVHPASCDTWDEIRLFAGNRRYAPASGAPLDPVTGAVNAYDRERGLFFMELLNFDTVCR